MEARLRNLSFSVAEILGRPGAYREVRFAKVIEGVATGLARLDHTPVEGELRATAVVEGVLVRGRVEGSTTWRCARCLESVSAPLSIEACDLYAEAGGEEEDVYTLRGEEIDLEPMLRDLLGLGLPLNPLCKPDCLGLCAQCGHDLNRGACTCSETVIDPRWAALEGLRDLLERSARQTEAQESA